jgi:hypothetical protein
MEEVQAAMTAHLDQVSGLVQALSSELRRGMGPAADNLRAFVRAVDWTVSLPNPPPPYRRSHPDHRNLVLFPLPLSTSKLTNIVRRVAF